VRAMVTPQFGGSDLFKEQDVEKPYPEAGEVLVRVNAAGTNPVDAKFRAAGGSIRHPDGHGVCAFPSAE